MKRLVVEIDEDLQQKIRLRAVTAKQTIKEWVTTLLNKAVVNGNGKHERKSNE